MRPSTSPASVETEGIAEAGAGPAVQPAESVVTRMTFAAPPARVWDQLMFFEEIEQVPPLLLRTLLPIPIRTEGRKSQVGDEAKCLYQGGHLIKRVTRIERGRLYGFDVVEQALEVGGGLRLSGGAYTLRDVGGGVTEVSLETRYWTPRRPRWLWRPVEAAVCHAFHRHILGAMKRGLTQGTA